MEKKEENLKNEVYDSDLQKTFHQQIQVRSVFGNILVSRHSHFFFRRWSKKMYNLHCVVLITGNHET